MYDLKQTTLANLPPEMKLKTWRGVEKGAWVEGKQNSVL
jgi:hypothetical protein